MPTCRGCNDEVDKLVSVKVGGKAKKLCADCADGIDSLVELLQGRFEPAQRLEELEEEARTSRLRKLPEMLFDYEKRITALITELSITSNNPDLSPTTTLTTKSSLNESNISSIFFVKEE